MLTVRGSQVWPQNKGCEHGIFVLNFVTSENRIRTKLKKQKTKTKTKITKKTKQKQKQNTNQNKTKQKKNKNKNKNKQTNKNKNKKENIANCLYTFQTQYFDFFPLFFSYYTNNI